MLRMCREPPMSFSPRSMAVQSSEASRATFRNAISSKAARSGFSATSVSKSIAANRSISGSLTLVLRLISTPYRIDVDLRSGESSYRGSHAVLKGCGGVLRSAQFPERVVNCPLQHFLAPLRARQFHRVAFFTDEQDHGVIPVVRISNAASFS